MKELLATLAFDGYWENADSMYLSSCYLNGLFEISKRDGEIKLLSKFSVGPTYSMYLHHQVFEYNDHLIFVPNLSHGLHIYDLNGGSIDYLQIKKDEWNNYACIDAVVCKNKLWLFMKYLENGIVSIDLESMHVEYYPDFYANIFEETMPASTVVFFSELYKQDYFLYGAVHNTNLIVKIDVSKLSVEVIRVKGDFHFADIAVCDNTAYISQCSSCEVVAYNLLTKDIKFFPIEQDKYNNEYIWISNVLTDKKNTYFIPNHTNDIYYLNGDKLLTLGTFPSDYKDLNTGFRQRLKRFYSAKYKDGIIELHPASANMLIRIDVTSKEICGKVFKLSDKWMRENYEKEYLDEYLKECQGANVPLNEWYGTSLSDFLNEI